MPVVYKCIYVDCWNGDIRKRLLSLKVSRRKLGTISFHLNKRLPDIAVCIAVVRPSPAHIATMYRLTVWLWRLYLLIAITVIDMGRPHLEHQLIRFKQNKYGNATTSKYDPYANYDPQEGVTTAVILGKEHRLPSYFCLSTDFSTLSVCGSHFFTFTH